MLTQDLYKLPDLNFFRKLLNDNLICFSGIQDTKQFWEKRLRYNVFIKERIFI